MASTAQNFVNITPFTMPKPVPANTADWGSLPSLIVVANAAGQVNTSLLEESKVAFTIKSGGNKVCGGNLMPSGFSGRNRVFKASEISGMLNSCVLKTGSYQLCVQFFSATNGQTKPISDEKCSSIEFTIETSGGATPPVNSSYTPPQNIRPEDGKAFTELEARQPVTFRWTPLVPKPREPVNYKLRVWQLMHGQNASQAVSGNQPIIEEEVRDQTQYAYRKGWDGTVKGGSKRSFVWRVEAADKEGKLIGVSEATNFDINENTKPSKDTTPRNQKVMGGANAAFKIDSAVCLRKENGLFKYHIWAHYTNLNGSVNNIFLNDAQPFAGYPANPNPGTGLNLRNNIRMKSAIYNGALTLNDILESSSGTISNILPVPGSGFTPASLAPNTIHNFQFDFSTATNTPVQFTFYGLVDDALKNAANRNSRNEIDSLRYPTCPCSACDEITINATTQGEITNNGTGGLDFTAIVSASPKKVKRIRAELVYFDMMAADQNCLVCNTNSSYFGNFINAGTSSSNFSSSLPMPHAAQFDGVGDVNISSGIPIRFSMSIPPLVSCCNATVNFCIRYVITFDDCTVCNKLTCYNYKITGCQK